MTDENPPRRGALRAVRFVGGPMHCYPVPDAMVGVPTFLVNCDHYGERVQAAYSLGIHEADDGGRWIFYAYDLIDDWDELEPLCMQALFPC